MNDFFRYEEEVACANNSHGCSCCAWWGESRSVSNDETDEVEADLAQAVNELSFQEREQVFDEIHGVAKSQEETPEFRAKSIAQFDPAVSQLYKRKRRALDRAMFLKPTIQADDDFKLLFLRADLFNAAKAANRMAAYFDLKLELFGEEKLAKEITKDDLTEDEFKIGFKILGMLPQRDRSGRPMHIASPDKVNLNLAVDSLCRSSWYQFMNLLSKDEAASKKGIVSIIYSRGSVLKAESIPKLNSFSIRAGHMVNCLPIRYNSYHFCYNNPAMKMILAVIQKGLGKKLSVRRRAHCGSPIEIRYSLLTFGIDCGDAIEASYEEVLDMIERHHHRSQMEHCQQEQRRRKQEESISGVIPYPNPNDVLVGRGHYFASHSGNRRYHLLIDSKYDQYHQCNNRLQKTAIATEIVKAIRASNGRFLAPTNGGWKEIDDSLAREKTSIAFRSFKKRYRS